MLNRIFAIALNTFREAIRNRVMGVLLLFALGLIAFSTVLGTLSLSEDLRIVKDIGLAGTDGFCAIIALFLGVNLLGKELDKKTVYSMLSKPIRRSEFLLGKYLGLMGTMSVLLVVMSLVLALVLYFKGGSHDVLLLRAECLILFEVALLVALSMLFSSFSTPYLSAMFTGSLWVIGRNMAELTAFVDNKVEDPSTQAMARTVLNVLPDFHLFYISGGSLDGRLVSVHTHFVDWSYVLWSGGYALGYGAVCLLIATELFRRRDFT